MNLKDALKRGKLKQFAKEHEIKPEDRHPQGKERLDALMEAMTRGLPPGHKKLPKKPGTP